MLRYLTSRTYACLAVAVAAAVFAVFAMPAPAQDKQPIKIGFGIAETGPLGPNGKSALLSMEIWAEETNAKGGLLGRPVQLVHYDDQTNPSTVPGIYTKLLDVDKVDLVVDFLREISGEIFYNNPLNFIIITFAAINFFRNKIKDQFLVASIMIALQPRFLVALLQPAPCLHVGCAEGGTDHAGGMRADRAERAEVREQAFRVDVGHGADSRSDAGTTIAMDLARPGTVPD
jgi:hypothetical protein